MERRVGWYVLEPEISIEELLDPGERFLAGARFHDHQMVSVAMIENAIGDDSE